MVPLLKLFDGKHGLSDVVEESPFRIFDTIRMIRRLVEGGVLTTRAARRPSQRISRPLAPLNGHGTGPQSMLGQWAMVPDQRGVVGDRRSPSRPLMPFGTQVFDQPGRGPDRRKPSQPFKPFATPGPTPLPTPPPTMVTPAPAPIPLTHKKVASGAIVAKGEFESVSGEIPPVKRGPTPGPITSLALEPTVQVKLNPDGTPVEMPPSRRTTPVASPTLESAPEALSEPPPRRPKVRAAAARVRNVVRAAAARARCAVGAGVVRAALSQPPGPELPALREALPEALSEPAPREVPRPIVRASKTPVPRRVTPAAAFDAVEADFFAREADLYKREAVETFDDLDPGGKHDARSSSSSSKNRRKRR